MKPENVPGVPVPGYEGLYTIDRTGAVYTLGRPGSTHTVGKRLKTDRGRGKSVRLLGHDGKRHYEPLADLYRAAFGEPMPEPVREAMPEAVPEPDECGYTPIPPMDASERWQQPRRVIWRQRFGLAVGARAGRWWVILDGQSEPLLIAPGALMLVPGRSFEEQYRAVLRQMEETILLDIAVGTYKRDLVIRDRVLVAQGA